MISDKELLQEAGFYQYRAQALFEFNPNDKKNHMGAEKLAELIRAVPGATRVSTVSIDKDKGQVIMDVRLISQKDAIEDFKAMKRNTLKRYKGLILGVKVAVGSIETKNWVN